MNISSVIWKTNISFNITTKKLKGITERKKMSHKLNNKNSYWLDG